MGDLAHARRRPASSARLPASGGWRLLLLATPGSFVLFPRSVITVSAAIAFGPGPRSCRDRGSLVAAPVGYAGGRRFPRDVVLRLAGAKLNRMSQLLRGQGLVTLSAIRLVPLGPFAAQNVVAGAIRVPFPRFLAASLIGILPGTVVTALFGDQLRVVLLHGGRIDAARRVAGAMAGSLRGRGPLGRVPSPASADRAPGTPPTRAGDAPRTAWPLHAPSHGESSIDTGRADPA
jgi:uncharacterized membrane protein YdjX (TVP38/TMEM64 family)